LEVSAWMFDRARCLDPSRLTASPFVSMDALSVLSDLLRQALKPPLSSSNAPHSGASRSSHDQNRGEAHDHAKPGTTASDAGRTAKASAKRPFPADRPVRRRNADADAGMAEPRSDCESSPRFPHSSSPLPIQRNFKCRNRKSRPYFRLVNPIGDDARDDKMPTWHTNSRRRLTTVRPIPSWLG
jgi:hypothetical protein